MKSFSPSLTLALSAAALCSSIPAQVVVDPATGHAYEVVSASLHWHEAVQRARESSWNGRVGRLAEIDSGVELAFLAQRVLGSTSSTRFLWLGGSRRAAAATPNSGWGWSSGAAFWPPGNAPWWPGQPDGTSSTERYLVLTQDALGSIGFSDARADFAEVGFLVEYAPPRPTSLIRNGHDVELVAGDLRVRFDSRFGGAALGMELRSPTTGRFGPNLISPHPGEGLNPVHETGQDATQTSPNGVTTNPIATFGAGADPYWGRETLFAPAGPHGGNSTYEVVTFPPFFWLSHEARDDAIAGLDVPTQGDWPLRTGWFTFYTAPCGSQVTSCLGRDFTGPGVPVWFDPRANGPASGIFYLGNEMLWDPQNPVPWSHRLCEVPDGRVAARTRISLHDASPNAIAGIHFRRQVPRGASVDAAYAAPGYALNVNRAGRVELQRWDGQTATTMWGRDDAAPGITSVAGATLEVRTHNQIQGEIEVWIDGTAVHVEHDPNPILGAHTGLFAQTDPNTRIAFYDRTIADVGLELAARWTADDDGTLESDFTVRPAPGAQNTLHPQYPVSGLHVFFNRRAAASLDTFAAFDRDGQLAQGMHLTPPAGGNPATGTGFLHTRVMPPSPQTGSWPAFSFWCGSSAAAAIGTSTGVHVTPTLLEIDGAPATDARMLLQSDPTTPLLFAGLSPFAFQHVPPVAPRPVPTTVSRYRMVLRWSADVPVERAFRTRNFGRGCAARNGTTPYHRTGGGPRVGDRMELDLLRAPAFAPGALVFGFVDRPLDLGLLGSPGCTLYTTPIVTIPVTTDGGGTARVPFDIELGLASVGTGFVTQYAVVDPAIGRVIVSQPSRAFEGS